MIKPDQETIDTIKQSGKEPFDKALEAQQKIANAMEIPILYSLREQFGIAKTESNKEFLHSIDWLRKYSADGRYDILQRCTEVLVRGVKERLEDDKATGIDSIRVLVNSNMWSNDRCCFSLYVKYTK